MAHGDFIMNFDNIKCVEDMAEEEHTDKNCKCKRRKLRKDGRHVYVWFRICYCGKYLDRKNDYDRISNNADFPIYKSMNGIDIHEQDSCYYSSEPVRGWCSIKHYKFELHCYCQGQANTLRR